MRFTRGELQLKREGESHRSVTRVVGYCIAWEENSRLEYPVRDILARCSAVTQFGTHECGVWFNGTPCAALRAVKREVLAFTGGRSVRAY